MVTQNKCVQTFNRYCKHCLMFIIPGVNVSKCPLEITVLTLEIFQTDNIYIHLCVTFKASESKCLAILKLTLQYCMHHSMNPFS